MTTAWAIWHDRNNEVQGEPRRDPQTTPNFIRRYITEYNGAQPDKLVISIDRNQRWLPPNSGEAKVNFDEAFDSESTCGGIGVVIRDDKGDILGACFAKVCNIMDPFMVEATATLQALEFAKDLGLTRIILEGDALGIMTKLKSMAMNLSPIGTIIDEAKATAAEFLYCSFKHIRRDGNKAAHILAKQGLHDTADWVWVEDFLDVISNIISDECTHA